MIVAQEQAFLKAQAQLSEVAVECVAMSTDLIAIEVAVRRALSKEFQARGALVMGEQLDAS